MKLMLSLSEDAVERLDALARRRRQTRSGVVAELAAEETEREAAARHREMVELLGPPVWRDGRATEHVRSDRHR